MKKLKTLIIKKAQIWKDYIGYWKDQEFKLNDRLAQKDFFKKLMDDYGFTPPKKRAINGIYTVAYTVGENDYKKWGDVL